MSERSAAWFDLTCIALTITCAWALSRLWLYPALGIPDNAPVILRPISGFCAAFFLLRRRGRTFADVGFKRPDSWLRAGLGAGALYLAMMAMSRWLVPVLADWLHAEDQPSFMRYILGRPSQFVLWLVIGWLVGGFGEELLFRGFLLERAGTATLRGPLGHALGIVGQALLFGSLHLYSGAFAFVHSFVFAVVSGLAYFAVGRNLWPLIVVHGAWNSVGICGLYFSQ
jgi:membrane protease YdiL (CAAX protease family)